MGTIQHDYVIATTCSNEIENNFLDWLDYDARRYCFYIGCEANNFRTFIMIPSGWKVENTYERNKYNRIRESFLEFLATNRVHPIRVSDGELGFKVER